MEKSCNVRLTVKPRAGERVGQARVNYISGRSRAVTQWIDMLRGPLRIEGNAKFNT